MITTALAITTAIGLGMLFGIGKGMNIETEAVFEAESAPPLLDAFSPLTPPARWQTAICYQLFSLLS
ncbi:hypothetical protein [Psychrobacter frigidicola]|uniref:hypothetical protein n=1 Tax=Psychrobacter frigidicola TaxID=45611 RepID=UPI001D10F3E8|nr:hypothetical protein [Psychrobacter frigidicola]